MSECYDTLGDVLEEYLVDPSTEYPEWVLDKELPSALKDELLDWGVHDTMLREQVFDLVNSYLEMCE